MKSYPCDATEAQKLYPLGNGLVKVSKDRISYLNLVGAEKFGESINMEIPVCRIAGEYALVTDTGGTSYVLLNSEGILYSSGAGSTIDYGYLNSEGYAAIVYDKPGIKGVAKIIAPDGTGVFAWESAESGYILAAYIAPDSKSVDVSIYNTDSVEPFPILKRFSIAGEAVGQYSPDTTQMLPVIVYCGNNPVMCGGTDIIALVGNKEAYHKQFFKVYSIAASGNNILVVAKINAGDTPMLYRISSDGTQSSGILLSEEVTPVAVYGNTAVIGSGISVVCIDVSRMKVISRVSLNASVMRVGLAQSGSLVIAVAGDGVVNYLIK
ncbi:MAG: DUF5711 family protein [Saccharofermentanales bacterium]